MTQKFTNNAVGRLTSSITDVETTIILGGSEGALFPDLLPGETFSATLVDEDGNREIIRVTSRTTNTLTVDRAQEGTLPRSFAAGSLVSHRLTAASLNEFAQRSSDNTYIGDQAFENASVGGELTLRGNAEETCWILDTGDGPPDPNPDQILGHDLQISRVDANGNVLNTPFKINRTTGIAEFPDIPKAADRAVDAFPAGTRMLFQQTAAPVGWTKDVTHHNKAMRLVNGVVTAGGTSPFTNVFGNRVISQANLPNVNLTGTAHSAGAHTHTFSRHASGERAGDAGFSAASNSRQTVNTGEAGDHTHDVTVSLGGSGTPINFSVQYVDFIICEKN